MPHVHTCSAWGRIRSAARPSPAPSFVAECRECADVPVSGVLGGGGGGRERRHVSKVTCKQSGYGNGVINVPGLRAVKAPGEYYDDVEHVCEEQDVEVGSPPSSPRAVR